jgi:hypothetical protein
MPVSFMWSLRTREFRARDIALTQIQKHERKSIYSKMSEENVVRFAAHSAEPALRMT